MKKRKTPPPTDGGGGVAASAAVAALLLLAGSSTAWAADATPSAAGTTGQPTAADVVPTATEVPQLLTLDEALRVFRARGLGLLIADANTRNAEGVVMASGYVPNPVASVSVGNGLTFSNSTYSQSNCLQNGASCNPWIYNVGLSDSAAIEDSLSGKRSLRLKVARNALAAAKLSRADAERTLAFQVKSAYAQVAQAALGYKFAKDVAESNVVTLKKFQDRYRTGAINEADLERIETQKFESDQSLTQAVQTLQQARVALAFLIGVRGEVPEFDVDTKVLDFSIPAALRDSTVRALLKTAFDRRPDLRSLGYQLLSAKAQVELTRRQKLPDITLGLNYAWGGFGGLSTNGPLGPQTVTVGLSAPIPVFYQLDGELRQAEAQVDTNALLHAQQTAQVVNDVSTAYAGYLAAKEMVERMEGPRRPTGGLLEDAKGAWEVTALQYEKGAASLTDFLDALRTYVATKVEYFGDLTNYRTAVYQLEEAVAVEFP
jgi:cobalt-zinc-cadmium efflux system outer membrane protein